MRPRSVAVTGASGLLGGALARRLADEGCSVRALFRSDPGPWPAPAPVVISGDLSDRAALEALVAGADTVFHIAAMYRSDGPWEAFAEANWHGTERLLDAALRAGVRRFVHCSTIGVHGSVAQSPAGEDAAFDPRDDYQRSKLCGEEACRAAMGRGMEIVILRPCGIYGPGDLRLLKLFRMLQKRMFVQVGACLANFHPVYIDDLVEGFIRAGEAPAVDRQAFIIGGAEYLPLSQFVAAAADALPAPRPWLRLPYKPMELVASLCETICEPLGLQPPLHRRRLTFFKHNRAFSIDKARRHLDFAPRVQLPEGLRRTVAWYRQEHLLS